ncbi:GNAT family N-acetyltransferase [Kocuria marina]|uniref:GNAT family N-acetyltransferase n=1 Tax=Kocuria marina TaxID=223184 RepID=UPI0022E1C38B|nr:GNAT family N-acetyltransferase [Kocuria marina]
MRSGPGWRLWRDPSGVPHVQADDLTALAHGHGYVTGLDRAWHVEVLRHRAEGRSAELVGPDGLDGDHLTLAADVPGTARRWWDAASARDREFFAAYARGISEALAETWPGTREVRELGLTERPVRPWDPWTPMAVHLDAHLLTGSLPEQLWRRRVRRELGDAWVPVLDAESPAAAGSNAWLVPGELSASGAPLLAADPHRVVEESGPYQPVCFSTPNVRVRGLALVGLPGVPHFGRTESAAWAITAAMTVTERVVDLELENRQGAWHVAATGERLEHRSVVLRARGGVERACSLRSCAAGFVLPGTPAAEAVLDAAVPRSTTTVTVVSPAPAADPARAFSACRELLSACTADDVMEAVSGWAVPCNDVVAADRDGACRHTVTGSFLGAAEPPRPLHGITVRANQRPSDPCASAARLACAPPHRARRATRLLDAAVAEHGSVRREDLLAAQLDTAAPHWPVLLRELFADTTSKTVAEPAAIAEWVAAGTPGRAAPESAANAELADARKPKRAIPESAAITEWADARSPGRVASEPEVPSDSADAPSAPSAASQRKGESRTTNASSEAAKAVLAALLDWDGLMAAESRTASLFAVWRDAFVHELMRSTPLSVLAGPTGMPTVWDPFLHGTGRVGLAVENIVRRGPALGVDVAGCAHAALERVALEHPGAPLPPWGTLHAFTPWRCDPALSAADPVPVGGDADCLLAAGTLPGTGPACVRVPAARVLWDLADPAASWWITPDPVARGDCTEPPLHRWSRGEMDHALPWVPAGSVGRSGAMGPAGPAGSASSSGGSIDLGALPPLPDQSAPGPRVTLRPVEPGRDAAVIHAWVSEPRARFWGMTGWTREQVCEVYEYLDASPTHHAWLLELDGTSMGIFQSYEPHADPVGATYRVEPGDLGVHVLLAPVRTRRPGLTGALGRLIIEQLARCGTRRIVAEPDVSNDRAVVRLIATGFELGPTIRLPGKTGQLAFLRVDGFTESS